MKIIYIHIHICLQKISKDFKNLISLKSSDIVIKMPFIIT